MGSTRDDPPGGDPAPPSPVLPGRRGTEEREARLAAALRANLRRRKAQARARSAGEAPPVPPGLRPRGDEDGS
jgi:hypothetical protein